MTKALKIYGTSAEDIKIVSALFQDAAFKMEDMGWFPTERRFALVANRFVWEKPRWFKKPKGERVRTALHFENVEACKFQQLDQSDPKAVVSLLAIEADGEAALTLTFSGGAAIRLDVECIDFVASDLGESWDAIAKPHHDHS